MELTRKIKHVYNRLDYSSSKKLFGNTAGFKNNLTGSLKDAQGGRKVLNTKGSSLINDLSKNQMLILNKIYNDDLIDSIRIKYDEAIENDDTSDAHGEYDGKVYSRHVREPHKKIPELKNLINNQIKEIAKEYEEQIMRK